MEFLGSGVASLGEPSAQNVVIFLHGSGDTGPGIKVIHSVADPKQKFRIRFRIRPGVSFGSGFKSEFESGMESGFVSRIRI